MEKKKWFRAFENEYFGGILARVVDESCFENPKLEYCIAIEADASHIYDHAHRVGPRIYLETEEEALFRLAELTKEHIDQMFEAVFETMKTIEGDSNEMV